MKRFSSLLVIVAILASSAVAAFAGEGYQCTASAQECLDKMATKMAKSGWAGFEGEWNAEAGVYAVTKVVEDSPAAAAGFKVGDALRGMNGVMFASANEEDEKKMMEARVVGATVTYLFERKGDEKKLDVTLAAMPESVVAKKVGHHMMDHVTVASVNQ